MWHKNSIWRVDYDTVVPQTLKNLPEMLVVFFWVLAGNQEVIDVYVAKVEASQNLINEPLECLAAFHNPNGIQRNSNNPKGVRG